ncbi:MAG: ChaN family lipoprotein [Bdellovibrio sp.]|nr:ChaN family lipoprotein [Bdellovibrio sp.]
MAPRTLKPRPRPKKPAKRALKKEAGRKLQDLQKKIYKALQAQTGLLLGKMPASIRRYQKECERDFRKQLWKEDSRSIPVLSKTELIEKVLNSEVIFIADFHPFDQSQRTALRIIRESYSRAKAQVLGGMDELETEWIIGVEFIPSQNQRVLDRYMNGELSEEKFLAEISYRTEWGFPWKNYKPIFEWARQNRVRVVALNRPKPFGIAVEEKELAERDLWAAGIITDLFLDLQNNKAGPLREKLPAKRKIFVLYGELHVGREHLPARLKKVSKLALGRYLRWTTLHQNHSPLYWKLVEKDQNLRGKTVVLAPNTYCVFSATPWAKLQSLVNWAERDLLETDPEWSDEESEGLTGDTKHPFQIDYLSLIRSYAKTVAEFLGVELPGFEALSVFTVNEADHFPQKQIRQNYPGAEARVILSLVGSNRSLYLARVGVAYLGSPSNHRAAEMAGFHFLRSKRKTQPFFQKTETAFFRNILEETFAYFSSLVINPHRKCDLEGDHRKRLLALRKEKENFPEEKQIRHLCLELLSYPGKNKKTLLVLKKAKKMDWSVMVGLSAGRFVGKILGRSLYDALIGGEILIEEIRHLFGLSFENEGLKSVFTSEEAYLRLIEVYRQDAGHRSKTEAF